MKQEYVLVGLATTMGETTFKVYDQVMAETQIEAEIGLHRSRRNKFGMVVVTRASYRTQINDAMTRFEHQQTSDKKG